MASKSNDQKSEQSPEPTKKPKKIEAKASVEPSKREHGVTIVGIVASAGGLDLDQIQESLDESISITCNVSIDLSPAIHKGEGLSDALVWLAAQMKDQYGLEVTLQSNGISARQDDSLRILLFQAVREILFNIVKHARTREATITLERVDEHTRITISDHGVGFDAQAVLDGSKNAGGLLNLQHRLNLMGCNLQVKSQSDVQGTQVIIDVPQDK